MDSCQCAASGDQAGHVLRVRKDQIRRAGAVDEDGIVPKRAGGGGPAHLASDRKLESVRSLVAEQPETVARVVKQWTQGHEQ